MHILKVESNKSVHMVQVGKLQSEIWKCRDHTRTEIPAE